MINLSLAERYNLSDSNIALIELNHRQLALIKENPYRYEDPVKQIRLLEFSMQYLWGFPEDSDFHRHWMDIKGCVCPKLDNMERVGSGYFVISGDCPWHGS